MYKAIVNNVQSVGELEVQTHTQLLSNERNNQITIFWTALHQKVAHRNQTFVLLLNLLVQVPSC